MPNDVSKEIAELEELRSQIRKWRGGLTLIFAVILAVSLFSMWYAVNGLTNSGERQDQFAAKFTERLQTDIAPQIEDLAQSTLHDIDFQPAIKKLNDSAPDLANTSVEQLNLLAKDLPDRGEKVLTEELDSYLKNEEVKLKTEFPEATDAQIANLVTNLTAETNTQVGEVADTLFSPHVAALNDIIVDLSKIETSEAPNIKGEIPTWQMAFLISDIARADINSLDSNSGDASPKSSAKPAKKK
ncbi:MAG: hypothetical protein P4L33_20615 [Capsulimonadaceae bacterium]|nr:hypothetical protein [Capsulimonadaceae bacterium]